MIVPLALLLALVLVAGVIVLVVRASRRKGEAAETEGTDIIPYLLLAVAVATAGFTLAALARASLTADRLSGRPTAEIAGALAGLVVSAPIAYFLWRRQARRRRQFPETDGWPVYLALIELTFLTAFFVAASDLATDIAGVESGAHWTDLVVYGGIVAFHWWVGRRELPEGQAGDLPRLVGAGVALIAMSVGLVGTLAWLFSLVYDGLWDLDDIPGVAVPLALLVTGAPVWAYRWFPEWKDEAGTLRSFYIGLATTVFLTGAIGALVSIVAITLGFLIEQPGPAGQTFRNIPLALAALVGSGLLWWHHNLRLGSGRTSARRGHEYAMAAIGLASLIASSAALVDTAFTPTLAGTNRAGTLVTLGCVVIASGWVWLAFWRKAQMASPREDEARSLPRRFYLIGMAIAVGLTAVGALIAALVIVFRALLGEVSATASSLRVPVTLTLVAGLATWHLIDQLRADRAGMERVEVKPYTVTVVCSHPGKLATLFPPEATLRLIYRADGAGIIDDETASAIVSAVDGTSTLVWVDEDGFRTATARH
jgi:Domain of unknown function (DUF5671)